MDRATAKRRRPSEVKRVHRTDLRVVRCQMSISWSSWPKSLCFLHWGSNASADVVEPLEIQWEQEVQWDKMHPGSMIQTEEPHKIQHNYIESTWINMNQHHQTSTPSTPRDLRTGIFPGSGALRSQSQGWTCATLGYRRRSKSSSL